MTDPTPFVLTAAQQAAASRFVDGDRYDDVSAVVDRALKLLEKREAEYAAMIERYEAAIDEALASGPAEPMEPMSEIIAECEREMAERS